VIHTESEALWSCSTRFKATSCSRNLEISYFSHEHSELSAGVPIADGDCEVPGTQTCQKVSSCFQNQYQSKPARDDAFQVAWGPAIGFSTCLPSHCTLLAQPYPGRLQRLHTCMFNRVPFSFNELKPNAQRLTFLKVAKAPAALKYGKRKGICQSCTDTWPHVQTSP